MLERVIQHYYLTALLKIEIFEKKILANKAVTKEDLIKNVNILSYEPLKLTEHQIDPYLSELCSKGPSFIPAPSSVNWYALLKDLDNFKHKVRCKGHFMTPVTKLT